MPDEQKPSSDLAGGSAIEVGCSADLSETVDVLHGFVVGKLEPILCADASLSHRGITCIPEFVKDQIKNDIDLLLKYTSQGVTLDGVTARLEEMEQDSDDEDRPGGFIARGVTTTYKLSGEEECTFDIGVGITPDGGWLRSRWPALPTDNCETVPEVEQEAELCSGCCPCKSRTAPDSPTEDSHVDGDSPTTIGDAAARSQE